VLAYGKQLEPGRMGELPQEIAEGLLYETAEGRYRLLGVEGALPAVPRAGFFFALAGALGLEAAEFARELAAAALKLPRAWRAFAPEAAARFGGGAAADQALAGAIVAVFAERRPQFSPFSPGGDVDWESLIAGLARARYGVVAARFRDPEGRGETRLEVPPSAARALAAGLPADLGVAAVLEVGGARPGTYPLVLHREGRTLEGVFGAESGLAGVLRDMARENRRPAWDYEFVRAAAEGAGYTVEAKLAGRRDLCYAVLLRRSDESDGDVENAPRACVPVAYTPHHPDGVPVTYGPWPDAPLPPSSQRRALAALNQAARKSGDVSPLVVDLILTNDEGRAVAFEGSTGWERLRFYHDPEETDRAVAAASGERRGGRKNAASALPALRRMGYDPAALAAAVAAAPPGGAADPLPSRARGPAGAALRRNHLYRLFRAEFAALAGQERDRKLRRQLASLARGTRFASPAAAGRFRAKLDELLGPPDAAAARALLDRAYEAEGGDTAQAFVEGLASTAFEFDRVTLLRLRALGEREKVERELRNVMRSRVAFSSEGAPPANIYAACRERGAGRAHCLRGRLPVPPGRYNELVSLLAADVLNPLEGATLAAQVHGVVDELRFATAPNETVEFLPPPGRIAS
jgi:hypothetical protein